MEALYLLLFLLLVGAIALLVKGAEQSGARYRAARIRRVREHLGD